MNTIDSAEQFIRETSDELASLQDFDSMEMYREILSFGKEADTLSETEFNESTRVKGCASEVHILTSVVENRLLIRSYSNSQIVKGILYILRSTFNGLNPEDFLLHADRLIAIFLQKIDVYNTLTPTRTNSIGTIMTMIKVAVQAR